MGFKQEYILGKSIHLKIFVFSYCFFCFTISTSQGHLKPWHVVAQNISNHSE